MKQLLFIPIALWISACATTHEVTTMDRELALKLADKTPVIAQTAPPVINIYNGSNQVSAPVADQANVSRAGCGEHPVYDVFGNLKGTERHCYGSEQ